MAENQSHQSEVLTRLLDGWTKRSAEEAHAEVERELNVRMKCFERWITEGRITRVDAKDRLQRMTKALAMLAKLANLAEVPDA